MDKQLALKIRVFLLHFANPSEAYADFSKRRVVKAV